MSYNIIQVPAHPNNYTRTTTPKKGIVYHWIVGELSSADNTFKNPSRGASAHFGIGSGGEVHQYVDTRYIAWHSMDGQIKNVNRDFIGIEHAGGQMINGQRKKPTHACHLASIELTVDLCKQMGIKKLVRGVNAFMHSETTRAGATQCCGSLDINYIVNEANKRLVEPAKPIRPEYPYEDIQEKVMYAKAKVNLIDLYTKEVIRTYERGQSFAISRIVTVNDNKYYVTTYSKLNNIYNGFAVDQLSDKLNDDKDPEDSSDKEVTTPVPNQCEQDLATCKSDYLHLEIKYKQKESELVIADEEHKKLEDKNKELEAINEDLRGKLAKCAVDLEEANKKPNGIFGWFIGIFK